MSCVTRKQLAAFLRKKFNMRNSSPGTDEADANDLKAVVVDASTSSQPQVREGEWGETGSLAIS